MKLGRILKTHVFFEFVNNFLKQEYFLEFQTIFENTNVIWNLQKINKIRTFLKFPNNFIKRKLFQKGKKSKKNPKQ